MRLSDIGAPVATTWAQLVQFAAVHAVDPPCA